MRTFVCSSICVLFVSVLAVSAQASSGPEETNIPDSHAQTSELEAIDDGKYACNQFSEEPEVMFSEDIAPMSFEGDPLRCCPTCPITDCTFVSAMCCSVEGRQFYCTGGVFDCTDGACTGLIC